MPTYLFTTSATVKEADRNHWWIDSNIIPPVRVSAESMKEALRKYGEITDARYGVSVSENAIRNRNPMYIDKKSGESLQIGYVITGKTLFDNDHSGYVEKYVDLWITIETISEPEFDNGKEAL